MTTTVRDFSISARTATSYSRTLTSLRQTLKRHGLEILCELPLDRELERKVGMRWQHYTVFVVWSPFDAYQALLSDRDGGLLVPFNLCVAEEGNSTFVAVANHASLSRSAGPIGIQVLVRDLARKIRQVLVEVALQEEPPAYREVQTGEAHGF